MEVQNTRTSEARPKRKEEAKHVQNLENTKDSTLAPLFWHYATFFDIFRTARKGPFFILSIFCNTMDVKNSQRVAFFTFFGTVTLQNSLFSKNFGKSLTSPKCPSFNFSYFATRWSFKSSKI